MPRRREGPVKNKQTGYYYLDIFVGFGPDKKRIRFRIDFAAIVCKHRTPECGVCPLTFICDFYKKGEMRND